jgi:hypothetical protein
MKPKGKDADWVELPGPSSLWPKSYDYERFGFAPESDKVGAESVYMFVTGDAGMEDVPPQFSGMLKSKTELRWKKGGEVDVFDV